MEKLVNSVDARLMNECLVLGIDPEGPSAPRTIREAVARFFEENPNSTTSSQLNPYNTTVYPNPTRDFLTFNIDQANSSATSISIYSYLGVLIQSESLPFNIEKNRVFTLRLSSSYEPGLYIYKIYFETGHTIYGRFIKAD